MGFGLAGVVIADERRNSKAHCVIPRSWAFSLLLALIFSELVGSHLAAFAAAR